MPSDEPAVVVEDLRKSFGEVQALRGVDFAVRRGSVLGLLGPNGAGKTTAVRVLSTLLSPDGGRAVVDGYDVATQPGQVRRRIGLAGQYAAVEENMTGRENLEMVGRLYHLPRRQARQRAVEVLERFGLTDAGDRLVRTYSGGMRRRLDLGASLVGRPSVLFLDEPTTGLDPRSRLGLWEQIRDLVREGTTLLLTTQYLDEADQLADEIVVIDQGQVIAAGHSDDLKDRVGGDVLALRVAEREQGAAAVEALRLLGTAEPQLDEQTGTITVTVGEGASVLADAVRRLDAAGVRIDGMELRRPSLDDVFLALTGHAAEQPAEPDEQAGVQAGGRKGR